MIFTPLKHLKTGSVTKEKGKTMSLDKAIEHGKEKRKPYVGSKAFDHTCRNHGFCDWCRESRTYKNLKRTQEMIDKELEYERN